MLSGLPTEPSPRDSDDDYAARGEDQAEGLAPPLAVRAIPWAAALTENDYWDAVCDRASD